MKQTMRAGCDVIYFQGAHTESRHATGIEKSCAQLGLSVKTQGVQQLQAGLWRMITNWHLSGDLRPHTHIELEGHGLIFNGRHTACLHSLGEGVDTESVIRAIRESGLEHGLPYFAGSIGVHMCSAGALRKALQKIKGTHVLYAGKKPVPQGFTPAFVIHMLRLIAKDKAAGGSGPDPRAIFDTIRAITPGTVSVSGEGLPSDWIAHVRVPADLAPAASGNAVSDRDRRRIMHALAQRIRFGKTAEVEQFIRAWPWTLASMTLGEVSLFALPCGPCEMT